MKTSLTRLMLAGCLALGASLTSCMDPYAGGGYNTTQVTTYRPGYEVRSLPSGYRREIIEGNTYYSHNGSYYRQQGRRYVVVEKPHRVMPPPHRRDHDPYHNRKREVVIRELPRGYREVNVRGNRYYQVRDVYYQRSGPGYVVVNRPY